MNELSRRMMVTGGNVTGITDQLVAEGLVERIDVEGDRRAYRVRLTPKGRKLFHDMARQHESWIVEAFAGLSEKDVSTLHRLLGKVKQHCERPSGGGVMAGQSAQTDRFVHDRLPPRAQWPELRYDRPSCACRTRPTWSSACWTRRRRSAGPSGRCCARRASR
jgi:hypothetical protein